MECISVKQPWAALIVCGAKDVENRTWKTDYRGRILIHASGIPYGWPDCEFLPESLSVILSGYLGPDADHSKMPDSLQRYHLLCEEAADHYGLLSRFYEFEMPELMALTQKYDYALPAQAIVGEVDLVDIVKDSKSPWADPGQYHWILKDPIKYDKPIKNVRGKLRIWQYQGGTTC
ncbi:MAG: ASCH domain-containing protein [Dehalococcoidia bacterium]|jgi:hypothetical protein